MTYVPERPIGWEEIADKPDLTPVALNKIIDARLTAKMPDIDARIADQMKKV